LVADPVQLVSYYTNRAIPISPLPGILVLSIIVSILGSYATLLLLGRRTSARGLRNHFFLGLAATCFAAVAVWGMHFVSMISIHLKASPSVTWFLLVSLCLLSRHSNSAALDHSDVGPSSPLV
jgi:NO-binding membrane sensor protein with MHYT domain